MTTKAQDKALSALAQLNRHWNRHAMRALSRLAARAGERIPVEVLAEKQRRAAAGKIIHVEAAKKRAAQ